MDTQVAEDMLRAAWASLPYPDVPTTPTESSTDTSTTQTAGVVTYNTESTEDSLACTGPTTTLSQGTQAEPSYEHTADM